VQSSAEFANLVPLGGSAGIGVEGYNVTAPVVVELAVERSETLIWLPNGKAVRVTSNVSADGGGAGGALSLAGIDVHRWNVWEFIGANALTILVCLGGMLGVALLDYYFGFVGLGSVKHGLEEYHGFTEELQKISSIVKGDVDSDTAEKIAAKDRWAALALDIKVAKDEGDRTGDFADVVTKLMELRADDIAKIREKAEAKAHEMLEHAKENAEELVHRVEEAVHHAEEQYGVQGGELVDRVKHLASEEGVQNLSDAASAGWAARDQGGVAALQTGVHAVDTAKLKAATKEATEGFVHQAQDKYAANAERARAVANDEAVGDGMRTLRDAASAGWAARDQGGLAAMQTGVHAVDTAKLKAVTGVLSRPVKGERYKALAPGYIRAGAGMTTDKVGQLVVGEEIVAIKSEIVDEAVRLQFDRGWVSLHAKSGKSVLELVAED
jgi:hypothetical protein